MRFTPTRPSRTSKELSRLGMTSCSDHVRSGDPVVEPALLAVEADPQKTEEQRGDTREVAGAACGRASGRRRIAVDVDHLHLHDLHAERAAADPVKHEQ